MTKSNSKGVQHILNDEETLLIGHFIKANQSPALGWKMGLVMRDGVGKGGIAVVMEKPTRPVGPTM